VILIGPMTPTHVSLGGGTPEWLWLVVVCPIWFIAGLVWAPLLSRKAGGNDGGGGPEDEPPPRPVPPDPSGLQAPDVIPDWLVDSVGIRSQDLERVPLAQPELIRAELVARVCRGTPAPAWIR